MRELERRFSPEFRNRIDEVVIFRPLTKDEVRADRACSRSRRSQRSLARSGRTLTVTPEALEQLVTGRLQPGLRRALPEARDRGPDQAADQPALDRGHGVHRRRPGRPDRDRGRSRRTGRSRARGDGVDRPCSCSCSSRTLRARGSALRSDRPAERPLPTFGSSASTGFVSMAVAPAFVARQRRSVCWSASISAAHRRRRTPWARTRPGRAACSRRPGPGTRLRGTP